MRVRKVLQLFVVVDDDVVVVKRCVTSVENSMISMNFSLLWCNR